MDNRIGDPTAQLREILDRALSKVNTCLPGLIQSFDSAKQTAMVIPAIKMKVTIDEVTSYVDLPPIIEVPLVFPFASTAGFALTLPVKKDDPCLLIFSQRAIDNWHKFGGIQPPEEGIGARHHDMTDAFAICSPSPQGQVLGAWEADGIELRNRDKNTRVTVKDDSVSAQTGNASMTITNDLIVLNGGPGAEKGVVQGDCICSYTGRPHPMISDKVKSSL